MARILIVDDQAANRDLFGYLLTYFGHEVLSASDGAGAVRVALAERPDLVLMDIAMPGMDGYTAAGIIRSERALRDVPLVAISATGQVTAERAKTAGFDGFYPMPIEPRDFMKQIEFFISRKHAASDAAAGTKLT